MLSVRDVDHLGIRVSDRTRALEFYAKLGFELLWEGGPEPVAILKNASGIEINLILNGVANSDGNVLMDRPVKHPGYTHMALELELDSIDQVVAELAALDIRITEGPVRLGPAMAVFVRDPDGNVIELRARQ